MTDNNIIILETENILLKKFQKTDFRNFLNLHQNPIIMKYFDGGPKTAEQAKIRFNQIIEHQTKYNFSYYNIFLKSTDEYMGQAGLYYNYDMSINLCYAFLEKFHHKGYATETIMEILKFGFNKLNMSIVTAMAEPKNEYSIKLLQKFGFKFIIKKILFSGIEALCYSLTKNDFENALPLIKQYQYRKAVGAILIDKNNLIYLFQRMDFPDNWQPPEGGIENNESSLNAIYREIKEEIGIDKNKLELLAETKNYYRYNYFNNIEKYGYIGQKKKFFLFRFLGDENDFTYKTTNEQQEFQNHKLFSKEKAMDCFVDFKKNMYQDVLNEFRYHLNKE